MKRALFHYWTALAIFMALASSAAQAADRNVQINEFGLAHIRGKQACISISHIDRPEGKKVTLVITKKIQKVVAGVIEREARNECDHLERADLPRPYYVARLDERDENEIGIAVAILKPLRMQISGGRVIGRDVQNGDLYEFSECTGEESIHLFLWKQERKGLNPIWHAYYYLPYSVEPSCGTREHKAMDQLNSSLNPEGASRLRLAQLLYLKRTSMGKYGDTAVRATELLRQTALTPERAWMSAVCEIFPDSPSSQAKGCPRGAFLGLYYSGRLRGISPLTQRSVDLGANARYAVEAISLLEKNPELATGSKAALWSLVMHATGSDIAKKPNAQMDVVVSLWQRKLIA